MSKPCSKCGVVKEFSEFNKDKHKTSGITSQCKVCREGNRKRWIATPEGRAKWNKSQRASYTRDKDAGRARRYKICDEKPWLRVFHNAVSNAKRKGLIPNPDALPCDVGGDCRGRIHYHHDSYLPGNELNVRPMCARHHKLWHMANEVVTPK